MQAQMLWAKPDWRKNGFYKMLLLNRNQHPDFQRSCYHVHSGMLLCCISANREEDRSPAH